MIVEHDMKVIMGACESIQVIDRGEVLCLGTPEEIQHDPRVDFILSGTMEMERLMRTITIAIAACVVTAGTFLLYAATNKEAGPTVGKQFMVKPIGLVQKENGRETLVLNKDVELALRGLDGFSHVWVVWWFDRNDTSKKRSVLQVHPRGNKEYPLTGVFACRSPVRPNLIGLTLCKVLSVKDNIVEVEKIDAFSNTPILDLKPYIPGYDSAEGSVPYWLDSRSKTKN